MGQRVPMGYTTWGLGAALLIAGAPSWGQSAPSPSFSADVALGVARESNSMRYSDQQWGGQSVAEDTVRSIWLGLQGHYVGGRYRLQADARWAAHRYSLHRSLDHDEHSAKAQWQWQPTRSVTTEWSIGSSRRRALPSWEVLRPPPSWETRKELDALLRWGGQDRHHVELSASGRDVDDSETSAYTQEALAVAWRSATQQKLQGSWALRGIRGRQSSPAGSEQARERYRGEDLQAQGSWWISGVEGSQRLEAGWGYGRVRHDQVGERTVQGHFGRLNWRWQPQRQWQAQLVAEQVPGFDVESSPLAVGEAPSELAAATRWTRTARAQLLWHTTANLAVQAQVAEVSRSRTSGGFDGSRWIESGHLAALGAQWRSNSRAAAPFLRCDYARERWATPAQPSSRTRWHSLGCRLGIALK